MKSEMINISPSLAEHFLSKNILNRNISHALVNKYATDMENGSWEVTHQGIAFYDDDTVADGQHRLLAIIKARATVPMMVTYGLKKESSLGIDVHRPRSIVDGIKIGGFSDWIDFKHVALINTIANKSSRKRMTSVEVISWLKKLEDSVKFAMTHLTNKRYLTNTSSQAAVVLAHYHKIDEELLSHFCKVFLSGIAESKLDTSIIRLRDDFLNNPSQCHGVKMEKFYKTQRVILALHNKEVLNRVVTPKEPIWTFDENDVYGKVF
jgi:hypothetical protein